MLKAWVAGAGVVVMVYVVWFIVLQTNQYSELLNILLWSSPLAAAAVAAYLAPSKKILLGISMALPTTALAVALNFVYQWLGNAVDFPGLRGGLILFTTTLAYSSILCGLGSAGGSALASKFQDEGKRPQ